MVPKQAFQPDRFAHLKAGIATSSTHQPTMRPTARLFAAVKPVARYLEAGAPTGLTGVVTNPSPRPTLLYLYNSTLEKLQAIPETSVYRQSVEAVTKHRMSAVESVKPAGFDAWRAQVDKLLAQHPNHFNVTSRPTEDGTFVARVERNGKVFVIRTSKPEVDERYQEWDGEKDTGGTLEGMRSREERDSETQVKDPFEGEGVEWVDEPKLTIEQYV